MEIGSSTRVPNGSCRTSYLTRASFLYEQSIPSQNRTLSVSSNVKFPCKIFNCKATLKEANNNIEAVGKVKVTTSEFSLEMELTSLTAISPLDGRYWNKVKDLSRSLSEYGLIYYRTVVEWLLKLSEIPEVVEVPSFSHEAQSKLQGLIDGFSEADTIEVKNIEKITNHDVKAVEYFLKRKREEDPEITKVYIL